MSTRETDVITKFTQEELDRLVEQRCRQRLGAQAVQLEADFKQREAELKKQHQEQIAKLLSDTEKFHRLTAISAIDGRYGKQLEELSGVFSEFALMRNRLQVEVSYLKALASDPSFKGMPELSKEEIDYLDSLVDKFSFQDAVSIKHIEETTRHDVKALEYYIKPKLRSCPYQNLSKKVEMFHYGLTSEDTNSPAYSKMLKEFNDAHLTPLLSKIVGQFCDSAEKFANTPMMSKTHGQAATPTTLGKEYATIADLLNTKLEAAKKHAFRAKLSGAVGNYNAQAVSSPETNWRELSKKVLAEISLAQTEMSTQTDTQESLITYAHLMSELAGRLLNLAQNQWLLISDDYLKQKVLKGEVGSSTMPHKVNPIDWENAEGNLKQAQTMLDGLARNLVLSRYQRDLSNSTQERNMGVAFSHLLLALKSIEKGLNKVDANENVINRELSERWALLAEPIQTEMRLHGIEGGYELLKEKTQGKVVTKEIIHEVINESTLPPESKKKLLALTPSTYLGLAPELTMSCVEKIRASLANQKQGKTTAVQGEQWGDEGKGKITDKLASQYDIVVRYNGGDNAGHSVQLDDSKEKIHTHLMPSGILTPGVVNVIANGVVLNPWQLQKEIEDIRAKGITVDKENLKISKRCHLVMPYHKLEDAINEAILAQSSKAVGTTKKGIGPTYAEKANRSYALRFDDLFLNEEKLREKLESIVRKKRTMLNALITEYELEIDTSIKQPDGSTIESFNVDALFKQLMRVKKQLMEHREDTTAFLNKAQEEGKSILFEGANAIMLDKDFGTYPFCTSSNSSTNGISAGTGLPPQEFDEVVGIVKCYTTRVGEGTFVTELTEVEESDYGKVEPDVKISSQLAKAIRIKGHEFGTTTGRPRRIGYLDLFQLAYALRTTGATCLSMMLFDVISDQGPLKICTGYKLDGELLEFGKMPANLEDLARVKPVYKDVSGFGDIAKCQSFAELPKAAKDYLCFVEKTLDKPIKYISIGPKRNQTLTTPNGVVSEYKKIDSAQRKVLSVIESSIENRYRTLPIKPEFMQSIKERLATHDFIEARLLIKYWIGQLPDMKGYQPTLFESKSAVMSQQGCLKALRAIPGIEAILGDSVEHFIETPDKIEVEGQAYSIV